MDLIQFSREMGGFAKLIPKAQVAFMRELVLAVTEEEGQATPVDTGHARSNWRVSINFRTSAEISTYVPGEHLGRGETANQQAMMDQARSSLTNLRAGAVVNLDNHVPYIEDLNAGTSRQALPGFIEKALEIGTAVGSIRGNEAAKRVLS